MQIHSQDYVDNTTVKFRAHSSSSFPALQTEVQPELVSQRQTKAEEDSRSLLPVQCTYRIMPVVALCSFLKGVEQVKAYLNMTQARRQNLEEAASTARDITGTQSFRQISNRANTSSASRCCHH